MASNVPVFEEVIPFPLEPLDPFGGVGYPGIFREPDGRATVGGVTTRTVDDAYTYVDTKLRMFALLDEITDLQHRQEQINAQLAHARAEVKDLITIAGHLHDGPWRESEDEEHQLAVSALASATRTAERSVSNKLCEDATLVREFPETVRAWMAGYVTRGHIWVMQRAAEHLTEEAKLVFEERLLPKVSDRTPSQLAPIARRIAQQLEPKPLEERHSDAFQERAVWARPDRDGMAELTIRTSAVQVEAIMQRLRLGYKQRDEGSLDAKTSNDDRAMPQWMTDAACATLVNGECTEDGYLAGITANVTITMPATALAHTGSARDEGMNKNGASAELPTGQLVDDETALLLAGGATSWTRLFTDPVTGVVVTADTYRPSVSLRKLITLRDQICRFPGCTRSAREGDVDHSTDWQHGGKTVPANLAVLCRRHHTLKHRLGPGNGWRADHYAPGSIEWTTPLGHHRSVRPEPHPQAVIVSGWASDPPDAEAGEPPPF